MIKQCGNCKHNNFLRTPTGKVKRGEIGSCFFTLADKQEMFDRIVDFGSIIVPTSMLGNFHRLTLNAWGVDTKDGSDCPCFEERQV